MQNNKIFTGVIDSTSDILANTDYGLSATEIVNYCNKFAREYGVKIPHSRAPFDKKIPNKKTALSQNLQCFNKEQQFKIIIELLKDPKFKKEDGNGDIEKLRISLLKDYGHLATEEICESELIIKTKSFLDHYPKALDQYQNALSKFENNIFERNTLDDLRLSFELLVKDLLSNDKSIEKQISELGVQLKNANTSNELRNMIMKFIDYYAKFQNDHVKHDHDINKDEIEYIIELTSIIMKFLIKVLGKTK